ncbi:GNAT family N-acetyltransferase, partial [Photobacterium sanctipauli]
MTKVIYQPCDLGSDQWREVNLIFQAEWNGFNLDDTYSNFSGLPPVIVALADGKVIGALAFTRFKEPNIENKVIWINALSVIPAWRRRGIARELIKIGTKNVPDKEQSHLYVYTNVPALYFSIGWTLVEIDTQTNQ